MQVVHAGNSYLDDESFVTGDPVATLDFGNRLEGLGDQFVAAVLARLDADECGDAETDRVWVDDRPEPGDHPGRLELADALVNRGRRQADEPRELGVTGPAVA